MPVLFILLGKTCGSMWIPMKLPHPELGWTRSTTTQISGHRARWHVNSCEGDPIHTVRLRAHPLPSIMLCSTFLAQHHAHPSEAPPSFNPRSPADFRSLPPPVAHPAHTRPRGLPGVPCAAQVVARWPDLREATADAPPAVRGAFGRVLSGCRAWLPELLRRAAQLVRCDRVGSLELPRTS